MSRSDVDRYLADVDEPGRGTLEQLRRDVLAVLPDAEECIAYGSPAFKVGGKALAGFAAFENHLSYLPHSGAVLTDLAEDVTDYVHTKGALHFPVDAPIPALLVRKLVAARQAELDG